MYRCQFNATQSRGLETRPKYFVTHMYIPIQLSLTIHAFQRYVISVAETTLRSTTFI